MLDKPNELTLRTTSCPQCREKLTESKSKITCGAVIDKKGVRILTTFCSWECKYRYEEQNSNYQPWKKWMGAEMWSIFGCS